MTSKKEIVVSSIGLLTILLISLVPLYSVTADGPPDPCVWGQPRLDKVNYVVIDEIADAIEEMKVGNIDFTGAGTTDMQADLLAHGFNLSYGSRARFGYLGVNCRDHDGTSGDVNQPLNYSEFRTALHYLYGFDDKDSMISAIYGATTLALDTIVPFAQTEWCASNDPVPGGNPKFGGGDPPGDVPMPTSPTIANQTLYDAGFRIKDGPDADGKKELYNPDGTIVRTIDVWYSIPGALLKEYIETYIGGGHGTVGVNEQFKALGVEEGPGDIPCGGLTYPLKPVGVEFGTMVVEILFTHDFDMNSIGWINLGRYPDWMYDMFHSNFAGDGVFKGYNYVGFRNATADDLLETIMFDLDRPTVEQAVYDFQYHFLYEWNPYIQMNTGIAVAAYGRGGGPGGNITRRLKDWMHMQNYGADNGYTWGQMHWVDNPTGACEYVNRRQSEPPSEFTPWYSDELYEWEYMDRIYEGLLDIHALSLTDMPYVANDWNVTFWSWPELGIDEGMRVTFWLKDDVYWQDGYKLTSEDIKANWDYLKKYQVPRYATMWEHLVYCETEGPYKVSAYIDSTSLWLYSSYAGTALFYPKWMLHGIDEMVADPADPWGVVHPSDFEAWMVNYRDFVDYLKGRGMDIEYGPWVDPATGIPITVPSGKWNPLVGGELKCLIGTGMDYYYYYDPTTEEGAVLKNTAWWAGSEGELFCGIDAIPDPPQPGEMHDQGVEPYEVFLWQQENDTTAKFEIVVRNLCNHNITGVYVTATLDCKNFSTKGPFFVEPFDYIAVPFETPVVDICQHVINQIVSIGPPEFITTEYQCNSFNNAHKGWVRYGASPYLDHIDYPTNYIESYTQSHLRDHPLDAFIGDFDFPIPPYEELDRLYKIKLCLYCMQNGTRATSTLNVYGACCNWWLATITPQAKGNWSWVCVDLELKTDYGQRMLHKLASEICLESIVKGDSCIYVDKAKLIVETIPNMCCKGDKKVWWTRYVAVKDAWPDIGGTKEETVMKEFNIPGVTAEQIPLPDCKVDMKDVATAARAFGAKPGHPRWWPPADIIKDFEVNMKDIATIARQFGYPW